MTLTWGKPTRTADWLRRRDRACHAVAKKAADHRGRAAEVLRTRRRAIPRSPSSRSWRRSARPGHRLQLHLHAGRQAPPWSPAARSRSINIADNNSVTVKNS
ncbi:hypothetical protein QJS66_21865 [Kocuria rhizophila]|nr:hypothetical protein QJS66_21865 [Kocuria rhizophila]